MIAGADVDSELDETPSRPGQRNRKQRPLQFLDYMNPLGPFAMCEAFPRSDYYGPSAPPRAVGERRAFPPDTPGERAG